MTFHPKKLAFFCTIFGLVVLFQNCEEGFKTTGVNTSSSTESGNREGLPLDSDHTQNPDEDSPSAEAENVIDDPDLRAPVVQEKQPLLCIDSLKMDITGHDRRFYTYPVFATAPMHWNIDLGTGVRTEKQLLWPGNAHYVGYGFTGSAVTPNGDLVVIGQEKYVALQRPDNCYFHSFAWSGSPIDHLRDFREIIFPSNGLFQTANMTPYRIGSPERFGDQILIPFTLRDTNDPFSCDPNRTGSYSSDLPAVYNHTNNNLELYDYTTIDLNGTPYIAEEIKDITLIKDEVYGVGTKLLADGNGFSPALWKNGELINFTSPQNHSFNNVLVESSLDSLYIAGVGRNINTQQYTLYIWKNGVLIHSIPADGERPQLLDFSVESNKFYALIEDGASTATKRLFYYNNSDSKVILDKGDHTSCVGLGLKAFANKVYALTACETGALKEYLVWIDGTKPDTLSLPTKTPKT